MIEINLLPRGYLKGSHGLSLSRAGKYAVASGIGVVIVLACITFYQISQLHQLETNIEKANQRASMLRQDIKVVDALIDVKDKITLRLSAVEELDRHRSAWVSILEDMARNVPEFVWLSSFREKGAEASATQGDTSQTNSSQVMAIVRPIEIEGFAFSLNSLAAFMIKMMRSDYFDEVELMAANQVSFNEDGSVSRSQDWTQSKGQKAYEFLLSCNVHYLTEEELRSLIAATGQSQNAEPSANSHRQLN